MFSHGRLRLYLLKLLAEGPKHGYELIRLLENRFLGLYAPSAGTIYPRLQRMEAEGLVTHTAAGGRKVYEITAAGRAELARRAGELAELEGEIHASVADLSVLAGEIEQQVSGSVRDIKKELREATSQARSSRPPFQRPETWRDRVTGGAGSAGGRTPGDGADHRRAGAGAGGGGQRAGRGGHPAGPAGRRGRDRTAGRHRRRGQRAHQLRRLLR